MSAKNISIPAAVNGVDGIMEFPAIGKVFACVSATAAFQVEINNNLEDANSGTVLGDPTAPVFRTLIFHNSSAAAINVTFEVSSSALNPAVLNSVGGCKDAATYTKAFAAGSVAANSSATFSGTDGVHQRRQIVIQNLDGASALSIEDGAGNAGFSLLAGQVITLATSGIITIVNGTGAAIAVNVLETFYS
ncbi:MAG: hypothetical protein ACLP7I_12060 [Limisphaerales bacterium]